MRFILINGLALLISSSIIFVISLVSFVEIMVLDACSQIVCTKFLISVWLAERFSFSNISSINFHVLKTIFAVISFVPLWINLSLSSPLASHWIETLHSSEIANNLTRFGVPLP